MAIKFLKMLLSLVLLFLYLIQPGPCAQAEDDVGYSVKALLPENQINEDISYFDLRMKPEQEQEIHAMIYNHENKDITVRVNVYNASTNSNGLIVYEPQEKIDPSLEYPLTDIITLEENEVIVPARKSTKITAFIQMPKKSFDGIKLGGLHFEKVPENVDTNEDVNIQNKYAYVIGIQLSEKDVHVEPNLHLQSIKPKLVNHRTAVVANLQNSEPVIVENLNIDAQVTEKKSAKAIKRAKLSDIKMAPNSNMDIVIDWKNQPLEAGNYVLNLKASDGTNDWIWEENFEIRNEAEELNSEAVELETERNPFIWSVIGIGILLVIIFSLLIYIRKLKKKQVT